MNMTSRLSKRLKMRRKPLSRRNSRSISLRRRVPGLFELPRFRAQRMRRDDRDEAQIESQLACFIAFIRTAHKQATASWQVWKLAYQLPSVRRIPGLPGSQRERQSRSSIRGNHMNLRGPSASRSTDGLCAVFFRAPVPSGCTLTMVLSRLTASILMRTSC